MATLIWQIYPTSGVMVMEAVPVRTRRLRRSQDQKSKKQAAGKGSHCGYLRSHAPPLALNSSKTTSHRKRESSILHPAEARGRTPQRAAASNAATDSLAAHLLTDLICGLGAASRDVDPSLDQLVTSKSMPSKV